MTPAEVAARVQEVLGLAATAHAGGAAVDVPGPSWVDGVRAVRDDPALDLALFDLLTGVDQTPDGVEVVLRVWSPAGRHGLLLRTRVADDAPHLGSLAGVYRGAAWHERSVWEMFGVVFDGHPGLTPLLLPQGFGAHPLRKDFVLASRVVKPWPGAVEAGSTSGSTSGAARGSRRRRQPPGVPAPGTWPRPDLEDRP